MLTGRPKIGLYQPYPHTFGGMQAVVLQLAKGLPGFGYEPVVILPEHGEFTERLRSSNLAYHISDPGPAWHTYGRGSNSLSYLSSPARILALFRYWHQLSRDLRQHEIALLHCNDYRAVMLGAPAARLAGIPAIWHMHGFVASRLANLSASALVQLTVPVSKGTLEYLRLPRQLFGPCEIIHNGVDTDNFPQTQPEEPPEGPPVVLAIGTLHPRKGFATLINAFPQVASKVPKVECWIAGGEHGDGSHARELRTLAVKRGLGQKVRFLGHQQDVSSFLQRCSVVAVPSIVEPFGLVALEAMQAGKVVVASRTGGLPEIVRDRATGYLVKPGDPVELASAILQPLRSPGLSSRMGQAGRERVRREFTTAKMLQALAKQYQNLLRRPAFRSPEELVPSGGIRKEASALPTSGPLFEIPNGLAHSDALRLETGRAPERRGGGSNSSSIKREQPRGQTKILHLITLSVVGGSQDNTFSTAELHNRNKYEVHVATNPAGHWVDRAAEAGDVFHAIPTLVTPLRPLDDLRAFFDIVRLLRREKFDLVHTHTAKAGFLGRLAAKLCRVPRVVHTYHAFPFHQFMPVWKREFYVLLERFVRPYTHFFITVSENTRQEGIQRKVLDASRSRTIYSGIDFSKLDQAAPFEQTRAKLRIPEGWKTIVMAGRLEPQKAPHLLVDAMREVVDNHPSTLLLVVGDGELRGTLKEQIHRRGLQTNVRLMGFRNDVPDLLNMADIFALSSLWEGLGRAMTEAMLLGKPVVAPRINGIPEIVLDKETGLLYEPGNVQQLSSKLRYLLDHPEEGLRLGENAQFLTRRLFDVKQMVAQIEEVYAELFQRPSSRLTTIKALEEASAADGAPERRRRAA